MLLPVRVGDHDVELVVHDPDATVDDLAQAIGLEVPPSSSSLGRRRLAELGLAPGTDVLALLGRAPDHGAGSWWSGGWEVAAVGGLAAGGRVELVPGRPVVIGRGDDADLRIDDPTVSRRHAVVELDVGGVVRWRDLGSHNGSWHRPEGDVVRVGASFVMVRSVGTDEDRPAAGTPPRPVGPGGTVAHNRPPRAALPLPPAPVAAPVPPPPPGQPLPLGVVTVVGPLVMAAVLVVVLGNPAFALFALLSPILAVGNHLEGRRRQRTGGRREAARWRDDLTSFATALADAAVTELDRRRAMAPDVAAVLRRADLPSTRLWERRPTHDDWLHLRLGTGTKPWTPTIVDTHHGPRHPDLDDAVSQAGSASSDSPVAVDLADGGVVGIVGPRAAALAVARSLVVQAAVHHGPADLAMLIAVDGTTAAADWDWAKWLPHVDDADAGRRRLTVGRAAADEIAGGLLGRRPPVGGTTSASTLLVVVDGDELLAGRRAPVRRILDGGAGTVAGIVVAPTADRLPASCTAVVGLDGEDGHATLRRPGDPAAPSRFRTAGLADADARRAALDLARFEDPESDHASAGLPDVTRLLPLLDLDDPTPSAVAARWRADELVVPIGVAADGAVELDLAADGPHALVAGTTGAGKSELLRTLVAGLAATADPDDVTFLLIDFKGGAAFDACARLPHTVGLVTDLDAALAARALRCLEAELRHRERRLRAAGVADVASFRRRTAAAGDHDDGEPLPRLVVVVDEFATLRAELPGFVDALVGVAQRGRSLGVHLVLATQRPAGAVSEHLKANVGLRIALRVQDRAESVDIVDGPEAAALPRSRPGRACVRFGPGESATVQTALVTARPPPTSCPVELRPFPFGAGAPVRHEGPAVDSGPTDLERLVDACAAAWEASGRPPPRRPWPDPLPRRLTTADLAPVVEPGAWTSPPCAGLPEVVVVGLADDPDRQRQVGAGWRPGEGNLLVTGVVGSGTTTTLLAVARSVCDSASPDDVELVAVDHGAGGLAVLEPLPHVAAVIGAAEHERQARLVRHLRAELDRRRSRAPAGAAPAIVLVLDGVAGFLAAFDDLAGAETLDGFGRVVADGPPLGIHVVLAADRVGAVPASLAATIGQRWVHRLASPMDASAAGVPTTVAGEVPTLPPGRFVDVATGLLVQVAIPAVDCASAFESAATSRRRDGGLAAAIRTLPTVVPIADLVGSPVGCRANGPGPWRVPIGIADADLCTAFLPLHPGDHVLVAGPGRSGRTTALATMATAVRAARPDARIVALVSRRSWLGTVPALSAAVADPEAAAVALDATTAGNPPAFLLVDDADGFDDPSGALAAIVDNGVHVVAAGRAEVLRTQYAHWTRTIRRSRLGLLLRPHVDLDGDLLGTTLPRRTTAPMVPGRGYLVVDGVAALVQVATVAGSAP